MSLGQKQTFFHGCKDAIPIALGYLSVSFAFGILTVQHGLPIWTPALISATNFTGTGQFVGADLIAAGSTLLQIAITILVVNLRYLLMSLSVSQIVEEEMPLWQRFVIAFGVTDEIFAVSMQQREPLRFSYLMGLMLFSFFGWNTGTVLGSFASSVLPNSVQSALGIAIYAMFLAIIIPPARKSKLITFVITVSVLLSCALHWLPGLNRMDEGWTIIFSGVIAALVGAVLTVKQKKGWCRS